MSDLEQHLLAAEGWKGNLEQRLLALETWKNSVEVREAGTSIEWAYMVKRFDSIDRRLDRYDGHISKFIWAVVLLFVGTFSAFVLKGGLVQ